MNINLALRRDHRAEARKGPDMVKLVRRLSRLRSVEFCESCGQVCTAACRAEAHRARVRTSHIHLQLPH